MAGSIAALSREKRTLSRYTAASKRSLRHRIRSPDADGRDRRPVQERRCHEVHRNEDVSIGGIDID
ncbi:hypothetical protein [Mesorhizobium sp. WSM3859]|nr:hypothetical protein [Mesorhizobium sp. WSM3859]